MTANELYKYKGTLLVYAGQTVQIVDWQWLKQPQVNQLGERIDAEPVIRWSNGRDSLLTWIHWPEVTAC